MPRNKEFNYDEKLKAARNLFWKKGYNATYMSDLVDTMKINRSSIYLTYGNKHDLFVKCLDHYILKKDRQYEQAASKSEAPLEAIKNIINSVLQSALQDTNCLFTNSVFELASTDKEVAKVLSRQSSKAVLLFETLLKEAQHAGTFPQDKDPLAMAYFLVSGLTSIYNIQLLHSDAKLTTQTAQILIESITR